MCGIAGLLLNKPNEKICSKVLKISKSLQHRGPDASSSFKDQKNLLIHTRLSIIDIRGGNQPLSNKRSRRSRAVSFPFSRWAAMAFSPPISSAFASRDFRSRILSSTIPIIQFLSYYLNYI